MGTHSGRSYRERDGQPALTVLEGGKTADRTPLIPGTRAQKIKALGFIAGVAFIGAGSSWVSSDTTDSSLNCGSERAPLVVPTGQTPSGAVLRQVGGLDGEWKQIAQVPVTESGGEVNSFGSYGPAGPPAGSKVPLFCEAE